MNRVISFAMCVFVTTGCGTWLAQARQTGSRVESADVTDKKNVQIGSNFRVEGVEVLQLSTPRAANNGQAFSVVPSCPSEQPSCTGGLAYFNVTPSPQTTFHPGWAQTIGVRMESLAGLGWEVKNGFAMARGWRPMIRTIRTTTVAPGSELIAQIDGAVHRIYYVEGSAPSVFVVLFTNETDYTPSEATPVELPKGFFVEVFKDAQGRITAGAPRAYSGEEVACAFVKSVRDSDRARVVRQINSDKQIPPVPQQGEPQCP